MTLDLLIYVPSLSGGGAERAMIDVATSMSERGYRYTICCNQVGENYRSLVEQRNVQVLELGVQRTASALPKLARVVRAERPRTLLATITHANVIAAIAARALFPAPRIVLRQANTMVTSAEINLRAKLAVAAVPWVYRTADSVIAVSEATANDMVEHSVPRDKIEIIANGVDHAFIAHEAMQAMQYEPPDRREDTRVIVSLGRLTRQKAFDNLLHALASLPDDVNLWIFGEGKDRVSLEQLARDLGVADRVWMPGFVSNPFPYIKRADCFVLCSRWEGMPNALVQALSLGVPSVATDAPGGSREVLLDGKAGWLVPVDDVAALSGSIGDALAQPEAHPADLHWRDRFSIDTMMDHYERTLFPSEGGRGSDKGSRVT